MCLCVTCGPQLYVVTRHVRRWARVVAATGAVVASNNQSAGTRADVVSRQAGCLCGSPALGSTGATAAARVGAVATQSHKGEGLSAAAHSGCRHHSATAAVCL